MKNPRIVGALFVGIALVVCAFYVRGSAEKTSLEATVVVADTPRAYIATRDSDHDGMRDWEEELYGTNPERADAFTETHLSAAKTLHETIDQVPDSMTKDFAISFFSDYLQKAATGEELSAEAKSEFLSEAAQYAALRSADRSFTSADLKVGTSNSEEAIRTYGNSVADALTKYTVSTESEVVILERALQSDNEADLAPLADIVTSYSNSLGDLLTMHVPPAFADEHLELLNALLALHNNIVAMQHTFDDALPAMVRFQRHPEDITHLRNLLTVFAETLKLYGATYESTEPGGLWNTFAS